MAQVAAAPGHTERADRERQLQAALMVVAVVVGVALRWVRLGDAIPTFDETFGARISRLPLGDMFAYLRDSDWHPPLDYLVRRPSVLTDSAFLLRAPSALAGTAALLAVAVWMRRERWLGVAVVVLTSLSTIQVLYSRTARMYAFLILGGTLLAIFSDRWLDRPRTRWAVAAGITVFVAALFQQVILFMVPGLLLVAGLRRDRDAWVWRGWVVGGGLAWFVVWGPTLLHQMSSHVARVQWIPLTTPRGIYDAATGQLTLSPVLQLFVFAGTILGGVLLWRRHRRLGQVWLYVLVVPAVLVMIAGFQLHLLLPRSISFAALAPVLSFAAIVDWLVEDPPAVLGRLVPIPLAVAVLVVGAASAWSAYSFEEDFAPTRRELIARAQPGDVVAAHPRFLGDMLQWDFDLPRESVEVEGLDPSTTWAGRLPGEPTGRLWIIVPDTYARPELVGAARPCDGPAPSGQPPLLLHCVEGVG